MNLTVFLVILIVVLALIGCSIPPDNSIYVLTRSDLNVHGENIPAEKIICIQNALKFLPDEVRQSVEEIHLRKDREHFDYTYLDNTKRCARGHNCTYGGRKVCILSKEVDYKLVWHEVAHVYTLTIEKSQEFQAEWAKIAGDVYVPHYEDYFGRDACEGMLTWYCRRNAIEDIAEWVEECLDYLYINSNTPVFQNQHFKVDKRYRQKLACLLKYGLIGRADYKKLRPLFE